MRTFVVFAPTKGAGRTATAVLLASAALVQGLRVLVVDAGDRAPGLRLADASPLQDWGKRVRIHNGAGFSLEVVSALNAGELLDILDGAAHASTRAAATATGRVAASPEMSGDGDGAALHTRFAPDMVLVDTAGEPDDRARVALRRADLVVAPFRSEVDAHLMGGLLDLELHLAWGHHRLAPHLLALPCGLDRTAAGGRPAADRTAALAEFEESPLAFTTSGASIAQAELPDAPALLDWLWAGGLPTDALQPSQGADNERAKVRRSPFLSPPLPAWVTKEPTAEAAMLPAFSAACQAVNEVLAIAKSAGVARTGD